MHASSAARFAPVLLAVGTLAAGAVQAGDPVRIQNTWSGSSRSSAAAPVRPSQTARQQVQRIDYDNRSTQPQNVRSDTSRTPPSNVQIRDKPAYQFTQAPPRSLW